MDEEKKQEVQKRRLGGVYETQHQKFRWVTFHFTQPTTTTTVSGGKSPPDDLNL